MFYKKKKKKDVIGIHIPNQKKKKLKYTDDSNFFLKNQGSVSKCYNFLNL